MFDQPRSSSSEDKGTKQQHIIEMITKKYLSGKKRSEGDLRSVPKIEVPHKMLK